MPPQTEFRIAQQRVILVRALRWEANSTISVGEFRSNRFRRCFGLLLVISPYEGQLFSRRMTALD